MRRLILTLLLALLTAPLAAEAQPAGKMFKVGLLANARPTGNPPAGPGSGESMVVSLKKLGYIEDRNIVIERRYSEGIPERLPILAAELVSLKPDVIYAHGGSQAAALHRATTTIPIVALSGDMVAEGLVASLARPGGNVTGIQALWADLVGKRISLLKEAIPRLSRVGALFATSVASGPWRDKVTREAEAATEALRLTLRIAQADDAASLDIAFGALIRERVEAMVIPGTQISLTERAHLAELGRRHRMPMIGEDRPYSEAGLLMSYGHDTYELTRRAASYVDKILKGAKPTDLPVEQLTKFELIVNIKTAKALGLTIPPSLLLRADQVIQ